MMEHQGPLFLLEEKLTYKLRGIFFAVSKEYGYLYKEDAYQNLLKLKFQENGINFVSYPKILLYDIKKADNIIGSCYPDFLIDNKVIIEIKAVKLISDTHINQLIRYLHASKYEIGFVVNFGTPRIQIIRRVYSNDRKYLIS